MYDTFYTSVPVVNRTTEHFVRWTNCGNASQRMEFTRQILWLQESESRLQFLHGGQLVKESSAHNDFYGYLTSCNEDALCPEDTARRYGITSESSLLLVVQTKVLLVPALETAEMCKTNASKPHGFKDLYAQVPDDWRQERMENGERVFPPLSRQVLAQAEVWSSKNTPQQNAHLLHAFKAQWRIRTDRIERKAHHVC